MTVQTKKQAYNAYKNTEINTADQKKLIVMLYDGAIRFLQVAIDHMDPKTYDIANNHIIRCQDIVTELMLALDLQNGGEVATNLFNIYAYLKKYLLEANIAKDAKMLERASKMLKELRDAWAKASASTEVEKKSAVDNSISISVQG